jgi:outer membrane lipoprotein SlyB
MNKLIPLLTSLTLLGACATDSGHYARDGYSGRSDRGYSAVRCERCGVVTRIERFAGPRRTSGGGAIAGAVVGGVLGSNVGSGDGRRAATVAGAVIGGIAGNQIERNNSRGGYELWLRMDDGRRMRIEQRDLNGIRQGDRVYVDGNRARLL